MKILLCGFMGSGKTTLFERIKSECPEVKCMDLDSLLHKKISVNNEYLGDAIRRVGWESFRNTESEMLYQQLKEEGDLLLSLGGGSLSLCIVNDVEKDSGTRLVWVETDFETCWSRVKNDKNRPLVAKGKDFLENLYNERKGLYSRARIHLSTEDQKKITTFRQLSQN